MVCFRPLKFRDRKNMYLYTSGNWELETVRAVSQGFPNAGLFCDNIIRHFVLFISFMNYDNYDEWFMMIYDYGPTFEGGGRDGLV